MHFVTSFEKSSFDPESSYMSAKPVSELQDIASQVRRDIIRMVHAVNSGHPGGSLGCADFIVAMYNNVMEVDLPFNPDCINEYIFFLSN